MNKKISNTIYLLLMWILGQAFCLPAGGALELPLTVEEPANVARHSQMATGGIPMPSGQYRDGSLFSLWDGNTRVPVQLSPIVKYPDGSWHWVLVSFPVSLEAGESRQYILKDASDQKGANNEVVITEQGDLVEVSNGLISFTLNRREFNGFESIKLNQQPLFKSAKIGLSVDGKGGAATPIDLKILRKGPLTASIVIKGRYGNLTAPTFAMTITLHAGEQRLHITHNLRNGMREAAKGLQINNARLNLGLNTQLKSLESGDAGTPPTKGFAFARPVPSYGWHRLGGDFDLTVFQRYGGRGNQGSYQADVAEGELAIGLCGNAAPFTMDEGEHRTSDIILDFGKKIEIETLAVPLHVRAPCAWYAQNDSMGVGLGFGSLEDEIAAYRAAGWSKTDDPTKMPHEKPLPNLYYGSFDAHPTSECDHLQGLIFGYLRTGQRGFLDDAMAWSRYWRTYMVWRSDEFVYGREGNFKTPKWGGARCCTSGCHFYGVGIFNYALLTGEIDALEAAFDWAEMTNPGGGGFHAVKQPGEVYSVYGTRPFSRHYLTVARAYDVARNEEWQAALLHYVNMATKMPFRDPRGFTNFKSMTSLKELRDSTRSDLALFDKIIAEEDIEVEESGAIHHPVYGKYAIKASGSWPEAMFAMANYMAWQSLRESSDPAAQLVAEDAMDFCIAEAEFATRYYFHPVQKCSYYYMHLDYPLPDAVATWVGDRWQKRIPTGATDSYYTKWWPNCIAYGYALTGEERFKSMTEEVLWWGLSRSYNQAPVVPEGEAPPFARIKKNTKNDWMTTTAFALGQLAHPKGDTIPPNPINDLQVVSQRDRYVELSWSAPRDEGGQVAKYQLKFADKPLVDYLRSSEEYRSHFKDGELDVCYWNMAHNVLGEPQPASPGSRQTMMLKLPDGPVWYLAIRSFDQEHNRSTLGNVVQVKVE